MVLISKCVTNETGAPQKGSKLVEMQPPKISFGSINIYGRLNDLEFSQG